MSFLNWVEDHGALLTASIGLIAACVATYYAILTRRLWRATVEQVALTREIFETTNRAWVALEIRFVEAAKREAVFSIEIRNIGNLPAHLKRLIFRVRLGEETVAEDESSAPLVILPGSEPLFRRISTSDVSVVIRASGMTFSPGMSTAPILVEGRAE